MKTTITAVATVAILVGSTQAQAQDRWAFEVRANGAVPTENIGTDQLDYFGLGFEASVSFQLLPHLGVYGGWDWLHFDPDGTLGTAEADFEETGYVFGLRFEHPLRGESSRGVAVWARAGGIVDHLEVEDDDGELLADSGHGLGWEAGAGLALGLGGKWQLTPGVRYRSLSRDVEIAAVTLPMDMNYLAFEVGLKRSF